MNEKELLNKIPKRTTTRNVFTKKYGMFGLALGEETYNRLHAYCKKHNLYKSTLVKSLIVDYFDKLEKEIK
jgi:predicted DNA-binding protein